MTKQQLIDGIEFGLRKEEVAIQSYMQHVKTLAGRTELPESSRKAIEDVFDRMAKESRVHEQLLSAILEEVKGSPRHDY